MTEENRQSSQVTGTPDFNKLELDILRYWEENKIFEKSLEKNQGKEPYVFYDGPPFATGLPHYGHILASAIKDAIPRYQTMKGKYIRRRWGWDCHGLPIENIVEQNLKISGKKQIEEIGVERFNKVCRDNVLKYVDEWGKTVRRMGRWVDFDNSYKTMDTTFQESVWWGLKQLWDKSLIYEDRKVLLYCSRCETPISNFEVAMDNSYKDVSEDSVYVKFKLLKGQRIVNDLTDDKTFVLAWTTTPWTLPGNTALNIAPGTTYVLIEMEESKERYILAKERLSVVESGFESIAEFPARSLEGLSYEPLYPGVVKGVGTEHKIYSADFVTTEDGTGIVHNAAMYGEEDYAVAKAKNLPREEMLDQKGHYKEFLPENLRGLFFKKADKVVLQELKEKNRVYKIQHYTHSYPHCYRCATPLYYAALPAWFIDIQKIKPLLLQNNESINWYPAHLKEGRFGMGLQNAPDWNISRSRYWATALPFWKCSCGEKVCIGSVIELRERATNFAEVYPDAEARIKSYATGVEDKMSGFVVKNSDLDLHKPYIDLVKLKCEKCGSAMTRVPEVVDCWVESGSMPFAELHYPFENTNANTDRQIQESFEARFPAHFVSEYIAQTRAWFYVMHVISSVLFGKAPFKNVVTTGNILAEDGTKMSKSKKNYPDPHILIEKYGVDALRFYLLTSPVMSGDDMNFSEKGVQEASRKVSLIFFNTWAFYRMFEKTKVKTPELENLQLSNVMDLWVLERLHEAEAKVTAYLDAYNTPKAGKEIVDFINDFSTWYVRRSRDRIKDGSESSKSSLEVYAYVLVSVSKLLAPFMPFVSDFVHKDITGESVHLSEWKNVEPKAESELMKEMRLLREIVTVASALRKSHNMPVRQPLTSIWVELKDPNFSLKKELVSVMLEELNVRNFYAQAPESSENIKTAVSSGEVSKVHMDFFLTENLKREGWAREMERQVQDLRKKAGLKIGELVDLYYNTQHSPLEEVLLSSVDRKKTYIRDIKKSMEVEVDFEAQGKVDGAAIWFGVIKA